MYSTTVQFYIYIFFQILLPYRLSPNIKYSSLYDFSIYFNISGHKSSAVIEVSILYQPPPL